MTLSLGRCYPERPLVRIAAWLLERGEAAQDLLREVLAHELAHVVVHERHGRDVRPHGRAWRELMRAAGFTPRVRLALPAELAPPAPRQQRRAGSRRRTASRPIYLHRCPRCSASRLAGRPVRTWHCTACARDGHTDELLIYRLPPGTRTIRRG
jgi:predicted SprT family Zn-dependent metalloprotease